ncbi:MAG: rhamnan synthesis F family protein [Blautia sp.]|nr:rhamnan synthesis F family protein [Lachnoclostridium sp.]MCM1210477.1 rhamnan synthesis F family protein [Blautia sp.]
MLSRIGIFLFRDEEGIVDDYVKYLLNDISQDLEELYIVVNGALTEAGQKCFEKYTKNIVIREDKGYDVAGWQDVILNFCGFEKILKYDELILFNDSFFGPIYPFTEVFCVMDKKEVDFWGLSSHGAACGNGVCPYGDRPRYLQTYFLGFRRKLVSSKAFQYFWETLPIFENFADVGEGFGCTFTKGFENLGYQWEAYSDTSDMESKDIHKNMSFHTFHPLEMVANRKFPVIKRKAFITERKVVLRYNYGDELRKTLEYVQKHTVYDISMIYKYLLRVCNIYDLKNNLNLNFILPDRVVQSEDELKHKSAVVIAHLFYEDLFDYCLKYLENVPDDMHVVITISSREKKRKLESKCLGSKAERFEIRLVEPRGRDLSALLTGCRDILLQYDYLCFVHDKKSMQKEYITVGASFCDLIWESMLKSQEYIYNILGLLEEHSEIGLLTPPNVYHGTYYCSAVDYWTNCYGKVKQLAGSLNLSSNIRREKPPVSVGTAFWCKTEALRNLFEFPFSYEDFPQEPLPEDGSISHAIERIFPFVAQHHGFLTGSVMDLKYAEAEVTNFRYMLTTLQSTMIGTPGLNYSTYDTLVDTVKKVKENYVLLINSDKKIVEKIVYVPKTKPDISTIEEKIENSGYHQEEESVGNQIGLKGAFVIYIAKKWPAFIVKAIRRILKY